MGSARKDDYAVDRECAAELLKLLPSVESLARANRLFLARAVRYLAGEAGIDQFIDFTRPVAIILASVLHFVAASEPGQITGLWWHALTPGGYLMISHAEDRPELANAARSCQSR